MTNIGSSDVSLVQILEMKMGEHRYITWNRLKTRPMYEKATCDTLHVCTVLLFVFSALRFI